MLRSLAVLCAAWCMTAPALAQTSVACETMLGDLWGETEPQAGTATVDGTTLRSPAELATAAGDRLLHPVEANEIFLTLTGAEREALRSQGFSFYDWGGDAARLVTAWNSPADHVAALAQAIRAL